MRNSASRPSIYTTILATTFFVAVTLTLGAIGSNVIATMRDAADTVDNERSVEAANAAINAMKEKLGGVTRDNSNWDDAYAAAQGGDLADWAMDNWGEVSENYDIYDGAVVTAADGAVVMSARNGAAAEMADDTAAAILPQMRAAAKRPSTPILSFVREADRLMLVSSQAIQPHSRKDAAGPFPVLSFIKDIDASELSSLEKLYMLRGITLHVGHPVAASKLEVALQDARGTEVGHIAWDSLNPGQRVYQEVVPQVTAAAVILVIFLVTVVLSGGAEARRMRDLARKAQHDATHDALSGLLNRAGLMGRIGQELDSEVPMALFMLDLDGFKGVNDAWGHQIGDRLIQRVAKALEICHSEIIAVARLGGDEFAILQRGATSSEVFANSVLKVFDRVYDIDGRTVKVGASVGHASSAGISDAFELLRRADISLYRAKEDGKGRAVGYHAELDEERERLLYLEDDLRAALAGGDVDVVYQPLVSAANGALNGVEALARWFTASGPVSPEVFIPLAERSGLIDKLGMHVLRKSVQNALTWPRLKLSVNVSPIQLCNPAFASSVSRLLDEEGFDPSRLTLEITEGVLMTNPKQAKRAIDDLRKTGVRFSLDDFGCGYASIGALRQFGFDSMKIDRSLVCAADKEGKGQDVLRATIALATALSIPVTAEGIETSTQADIVRKAGCDQLQGYLLGRPMSAADITALAEKAAA